MAFIKTSYAITPPKTIPYSSISPALGQERVGVSEPEVWDGTNWIPKSKWESRKTEEPVDG